MLGLASEKMPSNLNMPFVGMRIRETAYLDGSRLAQLRYAGLFPREGIPLDDDEEDDDEEDD